MSATVAGGAPVSTKVAGCSGRRDGRRQCSGGRGGARDGQACDAGGEGAHDMKDRNTTNRIVISV